ncbi:Para-hydroxybenzoate--polyprenyltransferase, mitochondrial precursor (PHB:polyprenyltransferase) [Polyrhizophydium stewartii]|uniref:4-hydroxybenzoate polyprenyltransferase, mitochondrial n=1 Tax=Polyrhizophydium stewartii TaxID=2732419 RepID=A0ABR4NIR4_9FUNG|nr:Para-hydroxybenzoate--polyprenyltransferase, mitochondrial precursor (PHB:polyprenyltransferase) [Polyrhizophydium stewartii]
MPAAAQPYLRILRIDKPSGTWLLFLPCTFSIAMATFTSPATPLLSAAYMTALFGTGALIMRGAGCIVNDLWDRNIDKLVERTSSRPLAAGTLTPFQAVTFLGANLAAGLVVLLQLNWYSIFLGASSLALVATYPAMKRITYWPQAVLGLTFNWGALLGSSAILGSVDWAVALPLYAAGVCWTLVYDTIYALQDKKDDVAAGVKSTALRFGDNVKLWLTGLAVVSVGFLVLAGVANGHGPLFFAVSVGGAAAHYAWQIATLQVASRPDAAAKFASNRNWGLIVLAGIVLDLIYRRATARESPVAEQESKEK